MYVIKGMNFTSHSWKVYSTLNLIFKIMFPLCLFSSMFTTKWSKPNNIQTISLEWHSSLGEENKVKEIEHIEQIECAEASSKWGNKMVGYCLRNKNNYSYFSPIWSWVIHSCILILTFPNLTTLETTKAETIQSVWEIFHLVSQSLQFTKLWRQGQNFQNKFCIE